MLMIVIEIGGCYVPECYESFSLWLAAVGC